MMAYGHLANKLASRKNQVKPEIWYSDMQGYMIRDSRSRSSID
jgi:hypothetical protein